LACFGFVDHAAVEVALDRIHGGRKLRAVGGLASFWRAIGRAFFDGLDFFVSCIINFFVVGARKRTLKQVFI
jgi:hypothetical protein